MNIQKFQYGEFYIIYNLYNLWAIVHVGLTVQHLRISCHHSNYEESFDSNVTLINNND